MCVSSGVPVSGVSDRVRLGAASVTLTTRNEASFISAHTEGGLKPLKFRFISLKKFVMVSFAEEQLACAQIVKGPNIGLTILYIYVVESHYKCRLYLTDLSSIVCVDFVIGLESCPTSFDSADQTGLYHQLQSLRDSWPNSPLPAHPPYPKA